MYSEEFDKIIHYRRSNRSFYPKIEVKDEVIERSLKRAILAPNSSNMQLWEFYWIKSTEELARLTPLCLNQSAAKSKHMVVLLPEKTSGKKELNGTTKSSKNHKWRAQ